MEVVRRLREAGHQALWAGGCVRDQLLLGQPFDYDVATSALPEQVREVFGAKRTLAMGAAFGVITVLGPRAAGHVEVATFRRDASYSDGRRPDSVAFSNAEEDAQRRDFTINGLFYDPFADETIDYVGGVADLERRVVRAIGDPHARFTEDKLRMLRGVRFAATFDFALEEQTLAAIRAQASEVIVVSAERIATEMRRMLCHPRRATAARLLRDSGLLEVIWQESRKLTDTEWQGTLDILAKLAAPNFGTALAVLLRESHGQYPTIARMLGERWRLANDETELCAWLLSSEALARRAHDAPWPEVQRMLIQPGAAQLVAYLRAVESVTTGTTPAADFCEVKLALPAEQLNPPLLLTGAELKQIGLAPGPLFKAIIEAVRNAQLKGQVADREAAIALARQLAS